MACNGSRGRACGKVNVVNGSAGTGPSCALKDEGELCPGLAEVRRNGNITLTGHIFWGILLVDGTHVILGGPDLRPGPALVQAGLERQL